MNLLRTKQGEQGTPEPSHLTFEEFFSTEYARIAKGMWLLSGSSSEGEDLAQEAMARAFQHWERVTAARDPVAYVFKIAINLHRRRRRYQHATHPLTEDSLIDESEGRYDDRQVVRSAVRRLPKPQREALVLTEWLGLNYEETAQLLHVSPASVRGRVFRARKELRDTLGGEDE